MSGFRRSAVKGAEGNDSEHPFDPWHLASSLAALAGLCVGLVAFFGGWIGHIALLRTFLPGTESMKVNTALGLVFLGVALWMDNCPEIRGARHVALTSAVLASLIGGLSALEYVTKRDFRIDELLVRDYARTVLEGLGYSVLEAADSAAADDACAHQATATGCAAVSAHEASRARTSR